ncbi:MAG: hypothetical protein M3Z75_15850 [Actinomycetota bacterium]|nr:hypothetical protein [Actinomycetota bacterium]
MTDAPDLVTLLYRADWRRLSLAAEVSRTVDRDLDALRSETGGPGAGPPLGPSGPRAGSGERSQPTGNEWEVATDLQGIQTSRSTLLVAPGGRYRHQGDGFVRGCDGDRSWHVFDDAPAAERAGPRRPPLSMLLRPSWLLSGFTLEIREPVTAGGREALRVTVTPRRSISDATRPGHQPLDRVEVIVDAELGILLRQEEIFDGKPLSLTELVSVSLNPAGGGDGAQFQPPAGRDATTEEEEPPPAPRPGWDPAKFAAVLAGSALGALVKSRPPDPFAQATGEEPEAAMPEEEPVAPDGSPVSNEVLHLLFASEGRWAPQIAATLHQWRDLPAMLAAVPPQVRQAGLGGLRAVLETLGQQISRLPVHTASHLRIGGPDRYQIDVVLGPGQDDTTTTVCDGQQCWRVFVDKVTVGPAAPLPREIADLFDASWLLTARLTGGTETTVDGRRGYRLAVASDDPGRPGALPPDEVVVDAEFGCLLRWISRSGPQVVAWYELRDVTASFGAAGKFRPDIAVGTPVVEEGEGIPPGPASIWTLASGIFARQPAKDARSAVQDLVDFIRGGAGR